MQVLFDLLPIFCIIALGLFAARMGILPLGIIKPTSRMVFFLGVPFMIFRAVSKAPVGEMQVIAPALIGVLTIIIQAGLALVLARFFIRSPKTPQRRRVSWVCSQFHGNMAIMGLAVVYYILGEEWLGAAAMIMAALMLVHTILAILILSRWGENPEARYTGWGAIVHNPIMIAVVLGLICAGTGFKLPQFIDRTFGILAGMALPLALLIVGAELSQWRMSEGKVHLITVSLMKMMVMPAMGYGLMLLAGTSPMETTLTVMMLASPCAAMSVIFAGQMGGDSRFAAAATSLSHAVSPVAYFLWMSIAGY